jgi:RNA polymerase sigma-70 factor (ECF subfamily)
LLAAWPGRAAGQAFVNVTGPSGLEAIRASKAPGYWMSGLLFLDLDLACYRTTQPQQLNVYRNDLPQRNWINVRAVGLPGNKGAMGALIRVYEAGSDHLLWFEELSTTAKQVQLNSYFHAETERHFGLGERTEVDVAVEFYPSGKVVRKTGVRANTTVRIGEDGEGTVVVRPMPEPPATPDAGASDATALDAVPRTPDAALDVARPADGGAATAEPPVATELPPPAGCGCRVSGAPRGPWASVCLVIALMALGARRGQRGKVPPPDPLLSSPVVAKAEAAQVAGAVGQRSLLETLYREHAAIVKRWALRLGGPGIDVEDAVHEVFLVVHRRLPEFRGDARITTWLYSITSKVVHKQVRKQRTRRWLSGLAGAFTDDVRSELPGPYESVERQQAARTVYRALEGLNDNHRQVVILYELEGMSGEEIAALLQTKLATVWVWLHRGRARFLGRLKALGEEGTSR